MQIPQQDTICAPATSLGGAICLIRVSGPDAITITDRIFTPRTEIPLSERKANTVTFGHIADTTGEIIDEVLVSLFRAPHSYTGEDSTEISCHGSSYIIRRILDLLVEAGCRTANPGEYTQRAFLNGKMDLCQAEAVADLISSTSAATHRMAMNQMRGKFSGELRTLRDRLLHITSLIELELDFSDHEDLEFADRSELQRLTAETVEHISRLLESFRMGNALKNGIPVVIIGETNAGKSTLLNHLLGEERAIVSDIHGTTRDIIEDVVILSGTPFRFIDTAGIRNTTDPIESIGIARTFDKINQAEIILWLLDSTVAKEQFSHLPPRLFSLCKEKSLIVLFNKSDLPFSSVSPEILQELKTLNIPFLFLSAKSGEGISSLTTALLSNVSLSHSPEASVVVNNARHAEALHTALTNLKNVQNAITQGTPGDLIAEDLRNCLFHLSDIMGEVTSNDVLSNIFSHFCIGK